MTEQIKKFSETKEFYELRDQFERDMKKSSIRCPRLDRENENSEAYARGNFYENGETNDLFKVYMMGYQFSQCSNRI